MCIVGEPKTPDALRNASDRFFEWVRTDTPAADVLAGDPELAQGVKTAFSAAKTDGSLGR